MKTYLKIVVLIFTFICFSPTESKSQTYLHVGYNAGFPNGLDNLNFIINRYNETRTYLTEPMKKINYLDGFTVSFGAIFDFIFVDFGYTAGIQRRFAEGNVSNVLMRRELKVGTSLFDIDFGFCLANSNKVGFLLGGSMNIGGFAIKTRVADASLIKSEKWLKINDSSNDWYFALGVFMKFYLGSPGFFIQPYYQFPIGTLLENDLTDVNEALNPNTYSNDPTPLNVNTGTFGIKFGLAIATED